MNHLLDDLAVTKAPVILLSPIAHEDRGRPLPDPASHNRSLMLYRDAIRDIATRREGWFIDLFGRTDHRPFEGYPNGVLTSDGIHLNERGYRLIGTIIARFLGVDLNGPPTIAHRTVTPRGLRFEMTSRSLPPPASRDDPAPTRLVGLGGLGLFDDGFPDGVYTLSIDGKPFPHADAATWKSKAVLPFEHHPDLEQTEQLRQTVIAKDRLYFYRWRPQNETYLFGFRKHEQGNNAREIPLFDPLVAAKEKEIARLKVPVSHVYELIRQGEESKR